MTTTPPPLPRTPAEWTTYGADRLPGYLGLEITDLRPAYAAGRIVLQPHHYAPNGYLHAATVITIADTLAGYGCVASLPEGGSGFTTIELKSNFLGTAREGAIEAEARLVHGGRSTQVWDAEVRQEGSGRVIAAFRCTQMVLYPQPTG